jgi:hypothetical protein
MIKKFIVPLIIFLWLCIFACSYDLKHITLDQKSDSGWTEVKKANPSGSAEIIKPAISTQTNSETKAKSSDSSEYADKLRELKKLKDEGLLTDKEYEQKRKSIVDGM